MWEADLDTVYEAVSDGFEEDERLMVFRVENDLLKFTLGLFFSICACECISSVSVLEEP